MLSVPQPEIAPIKRLINRYMDIQEMPFQCETRDPQDTLHVAAQFASLLQPGDIVFLSGPLGAGKTHFVRGLCEGLGMKAIWEVDSPTYTVVNHYDVGTGIEHIDLYRLSGAADLDEIDFDDMLVADTIKLIEWPERLDDYPINPQYLVRLDVTDPNTRSLTISRFS